MESTQKNHPAPMDPPIAGNFLRLDPSRYTILVIDDEERQLKMLRYLIERAGFRVETAKSAAEGLNAMGHRYIDLVICDLRMPELDGLSFVRYIKGLRTFPRDSVIPVMVLTAAGPAMEEEAFRAGADMFCLKSEALTELIPKIHKILDRSRP